MNVDKLVDWGANILVWLDQRGEDIWEAIENTSTEKLFADAEASQQ